MKRGQRQTGFTIVELLIVVVVIAILAAITIVSYNGITKQANDTAIRSDVSNLAKQLLREQAETGTLPAVGTETGSANTSFPGIIFKPTKGSYESVGNNLYVCKPQSGEQVFGIAVASASGAIIAYQSERGFIDYTASYGSSSVICPALLGTTSFWFSYGKPSGAGWNSWIE